MSKFLSILILFIVLTGCGAKGALYLPADTAKIKSDENHSNNESAINQNTPVIAEPKTLKDKPES